MPTRQPIATYLDERDELALRVRARATHQSLAACVRAAVRTWLETPLTNEKGPGQMAGPLEVQHNPPGHDRRERSAR